MKKKIIKNLIFATAVCITFIVLAITIITALLVFLSPAYVAYTTHNPVFLMLFTLSSIPAIVVSIIGLAIIGGLGELFDNLSYRL